jgi:hypothetical protein
MTSPDLCGHRIKDVRYALRGFRCYVCETSSLTRNFCVHEKTSEHQDREAAIKTMAAFLTALVEFAKNTEPVAVK